MSKNPSMKLHEWQSKGRSFGSDTTAKEGIDGLNCMVCDKSIEGYYARYGDHGTCSGECMREQVKLPRYPGFSEEDFLKRNPEVKRATRNPRKATPAAAG